MLFIPDNIVHKTGFEVPAAFATINNVCSDDVNAPLSITTNFPWSHLTAMPFLMNDGTLFSSGYTPFVCFVTEKMDDKDGGTWTNGGGQNATWTALPTLNPVNAYPKGETPVMLTYSGWTQLTDWCLHMKTDNHKMKCTMMILNEDTGMWHSAIGKLN